MPAVRAFVLALLITSAACPASELRDALDSLGEDRREVTAAVEALAQARVAVDLARDELGKARAQFAAARPTFPVDVLDQPDAGAPLSDGGPLVTCRAEGRCTFMPGAVGRLLAAPQVFIGESQIMPLLRNGVESGFEVQAVGEGSFIDAIGFKAGDVITAVNGQPVLTAEQLFGLIDMNKRPTMGSTVKITGDRKGKPFEITLGFE